MSRAPVHRNDPCPCGSGRKFKACHGRQSGTISRPVALPLWVVIVGVLVVGGAAAAVGIRFASRPTTVANRVMPAPLGAALPSPGAASAVGSEPAPWTYDPRTNKHWHPGHRHWHDGVAPTSAARDSAAQAPTIRTVTTPAAAPVATPEPEAWSYVESRKQYWDPRHHHWHNGPSPTLAQRESLMALTKRTTTTIKTAAPATPAATTPAATPADTTDH